MPSALSQEALLAGGEIVVADHLVARGEQAVHQVAADEAGGAGDEDTSK